MTLIRVYTSSWHKVWELPKLIGHEGNQRSDNQDETWHELCCILVDKRLAASCSKNYKSVLSFVDENLDCLKLTWEEIIVAKAFLQDFAISLIIIWHSKAGLIDVVDVDLDIFYMLINLLKFVHHLFKAFAKHLLVFFFFLLFQLGNPRSN